MKTLRLALLALAAPLLRAEEVKRPNIVFCFADDWGRYASCYAKIDGRPSLNQVVKTPNIDRIAGEGVLFRHAFVTSPSCTPCRSSLLSGQYFFRTHLGAILNGAQWDSAIPTFPLLLRDAGREQGRHRDDADRQDEDRQQQLDEREPGRYAATLTRSTRGYHRHHQTCPTISTERDWPD